MIIPFRIDSDKKKNIYDRNSSAVGVLEPNEIYHTQNFSIFSIPLNQRDCNARTAKKLLEAVKNKNLLHISPIIVNSQFQVVNGQNRLYVAKKLDLPIYFFIAEGVTEQDIALSTTTRGWMLKDFLKFYSTYNPEYVVIKELYEQFNFPLNFIIRKCSTFVTAADLFRKGEYKIQKNKDDIKTTFIFMKAVYDISKKYLKQKEISVNGLAAIYKLVGNDNYDSTKMLRKINLYPDDIVDAFAFRRAPNIYDSLVCLYKKADKSNLDVDTPQMSFQF